MKKNLRLFVGAAIGAAASLAFTSCAYDPYASTSVGGTYNSGGGYSVGGSYSNGYGDGYGYGGSSFSTSVFVATGNPRWGYDPYCYSYYDYSRRCYYDPYLNGYYPGGYRPAVVYGVPHPYGWRPGSGYCPPPRSVTNVTVVNYRNRESAYRSTNYGWSKQVRQQAPNRSGTQSYQPTRDSRPVYGSRPQASDFNNRIYQNQPRNQSREAVRGSSQSGSRQQTQSRYNAPVTTYSQQQPKNSQRAERQQFSQEQRPQLGNPGTERAQANRSQAQLRAQDGKAHGKSKGKSRGEDEANAVRGYR